jgi:hypothetical protein
MRIGEEIIRKYFMKYVIIFIILFSSNILFASDHVDPSEYMDPEDEDNSISLFPLIAVGGLIYAVYRMFAFFNEAKGKITPFDKIIVFICGLCILFFAIGFFKVPYNYFVFLRFAISIGAIVCLLHELQNTKEHHWKVYFLVILILHNPIYPIHLYYKTIWLIIDFLFGIIFFTKISIIVEKAEQN